MTDDTNKMDARARRFWEGRLARLLDQHRRLKERLPEGAPAVVGLRKRIQRLRKLLGDKEA
jgi:hypothetical protein